MGDQSKLEGKRHHYRESEQMTVWQGIERTRLLAVESWVEEIQRWASSKDDPPPED